MRQRPNQRSVAFSSDPDQTYGSDGGANLENVQVGAGVDSSQEQQRLEMLKKIKKARDLVFTTSKKRTRRAAIASCNTMEQE